jgi:hypothetical protein
MGATMQRWMWLVVLGLVACGGPQGDDGDDGDDDDDDDSFQAVDFEEVCADAADCALSVGQAFDIDECVEASEEARAQAIADGCGNEYRRLLSCSIETAECDDGFFVSEGCDAEVDDYLDCLVGGTYYYTDYTDYTDTDYTYTDEPTEPDFVAIDAAMAGCSGDTAELELWASAPGATEGIVDFADTVNGPNNYYESHPMTPRTDTEFVATLPSTGSYVAGAETLYPCSPGQFHDEDPKGSQMSYVFRLYDGNELLDCFAVGHDPSGLLGGAYETYGNTIDHGDVSAANCALGSWAR